MCDVQGHVTTSPTSENGALHAPPPLIFPRSTTEGRHTFLFFNNISGWISRGTWQPPGGRIRLVYCMTGSLLAHHVSLLAALDITNVFIFF